MHIFRIIWFARLLPGYRGGQGLTMSIHASTQLKHTNISHHGKNIINSKWVVWVLLFPLICTAQDTTDSLYTQLEAKGEWKSYYVGNDSEGFEFVSIDGEVDSLVFVGDKSMESWVLNRLFRPIRSQTTTHGAMSQFRDIQDAYAFIDQKTTLAFARYGKDRVAAVVHLQPQFKSQIGGIIGASKDKSGEWVTTGEIDLHLENTRKQGGVIDLQWQQPNPQTRSLHFAIETPFPFGLPFGTLIRYEQDFLEKVYILESTSGMITGVGPLGRWTIGGKTEIGKDLELDTRFDSESVILGLKGDRRNNRWMPSQGRFWSFNYALGRVKDEDDQKRMIEADFQWDRYRTLPWGTFRFFVHGDYAFMDGGKLPQSKKVKLGGANSVRGYFENQFMVDWAVVHTIEWLFGDLDRSQLFLFVDAPVANFGRDEGLMGMVKTMTLKPGYGVGFRQYNGTITMDISVGFSSSSPGSKLHLKFSSDL